MQLPKTGDGFNLSLLPLAYVAIKEKISFIEFRNSIMNSNKEGSRTITERELSRAYSNASSTFISFDNYKTHSNKKRKIDQTKEGVTDFYNIATKIERDFNFRDLKKASPILIPDSKDDQLITFLKNIFEPEEIVFFGKYNHKGEIGKNMLRVSDLILKIKKESFIPESIAVNSFSGQSYRNSDGGFSFRNDKAVSVFKRVLVEFDPPNKIDKPNLNKIYSVQNQLNFWTKFNKHKILALVFSGNKSIHAWLKVSDVSDKSDWDKKIKSDFYNQFIRLGADRACCNPSRISRAPGYFRSEKGYHQELLWLSKDGGYVDVK